MNGIDIRMSCDDLASFLDIKNQEFDIYNEFLSSFNLFSESHSHEYASRLIHKDPNHFFILNEDVTIFTPRSQVVAKSYCTMLSLNLKL